MLTGFVDVFTPILRITFSKWHADIKYGLNIDLVALRLPKKIRQLSRPD